MHNFPTLSAQHGCAPSPRRKGLSAWLARSLPPLACSLVLAGCTSLAPVYERPTTALPAQFADSRPVQASDVNQLAWRDYFRHPELQTLIEHALQHNRDLQAAMLQVAQARAAYGIARAERSPAVGLGLESQRAQVPGDLNISGQPVISSQHQLGVGFTSWELDVWGRVRSMNEAALHSYWASAEGQRAAHLLLVAQVADGWLAVRELDWRIHLAEQALATRAEARRVFARRVEVGSSSRLDFVQVELLWQQAGTLVAQLRLQRSTQLHALGLLVGQPDLALPPSPKPLAELLPLAPLAPGLPAQLLENRPDILAAEHQLQAANARIGAARAMYFPRIALTALGGTASAELDGLFTAGSRAWTFAPSIALPLFDGGRRKANVQLSEVQREQAVNHYQRTIEAAFRDVADALAANQWLDTQLHSLQATEATLTERARLARRRYDAGATRYFEVLDAERDLLAAQQQVVQAERALHSARLQLYTALGGGSAQLPPPTAD